MSSHSETTPNGVAARSSYFDKYYPDRNGKGKAPESPVSPINRRPSNTTTILGPVGLGLSGESAALERAEKEKVENKVPKSRRTSSISNLLAFGLGSAAAASSKVKGAGGAGVGGPKVVERRPSATSFVLEQSLDSLKVAPPITSTSAIIPNGLASSPPLPYDPPSSHSALRNSSSNQSLQSSNGNRLPFPSSSSSKPFLPSSDEEDEFDIPPAVPRPPRDRQLNKSIRRSGSFASNVFPSVIRPGSRPSSVYSNRDRDNSDNFSLRSNATSSSSINRPLSNVFPSSPRQMRSNTSLRNSSSTSSSLSNSNSNSKSSYRSVSSPGHNSISERRISATQLEDLFAGPEPIRLRFDENNGSYIATYPQVQTTTRISASSPPSKRMEQNTSVEDLDELADMVELMHTDEEDGDGPDGVGFSPTPFGRTPRSREFSAESAVSNTSGFSMESYASMTAGPTPSQIAARNRALAAAAAAGAFATSTGMERGDTLKQGDPGTAPAEDVDRVPSAPSIDDIVRSFKPPESPHSIPRRTSSISHLTTALPATIIPTPTPAPSTPTHTVPDIPTRRSSIHSSRSNQSSPPASPSLLNFPAVFSTPMSSPRPPSPPEPKPKLHIKTIEEIILEHAGAKFLSKPPGPPGSTISTPTPAERLVESTRKRELSYDSLHASKHSIDSIGEEISMTLKNSPGLGQTTSTLSGGESTTPARKDSDARSFKSLGSTSRTGSPAAALEKESLAVERELAKLLKSARLTRLLTLKRHPNAGLQVSLADVGSATGHPVVVYLGLGCVRYLIALYDEIAIAFNLRLICLDRWGLGKTGEVPDEKRGFLEWSSVVGEVMDQLGVNKFSVLAHSAGCPYALATSLSLQGRVTGSIHLLAPWVAASADSLAGAFKYLKYVPTGVLKTAQAADWKMQAWRLGKPPTIVHAPIGYNHRAGISSTDQQTLVAVAPVSPVLAVWSDEDDSMSELEGSALSGDSMPTASTLPLPLPTPPSTFNGKGSIGRSSTRSAKSSKSFMGGMFGGGARTPKSSAGSDHGSLATPPPSNNNLSLSTSTRNGSGRRGSTISNMSASTSMMTPPPSTSTSTSTAIDSSSPSTGITSVSGTDLANGLLRASHAESLKGSTSDLMVILERTSKPAGFKYSDVKISTKVWYGEKDDRISLSSVRMMEKEMKDCQVKIVEGADHSLMTNGRVVLEVLQSISKDWSS